MTPWSIEKVGRIMKKGSEGSDCRRDLDLLRIPSSIGRSKNQSDEEVPDEKVILTKNLQLNLRCFQSVVRTFENIKMVSIGELFVSDGWSMIRSIVSRGLMQNQHKLLDYHVDYIKVALDLAIFWFWEVLTPPTGKPIFGMIREFRQIYQFI
jgi:hypothetical protein